MVKKVKARFSKGKIEPLEPVSLEEGQEIIISIDEAPAPARRSRRRPKGFTIEDSMWKLVGIGGGEEATDISQNIHKYVADAYEQKGR